MTWGEADMLESTPLAELELVLRSRDVTRDLVDAQVAAAVARAREAGVGWGSIAVTLRHADSRARRASAPGAKPMW